MCDSTAFLQAIDNCTGNMWSPTCHETIATAAAVHGGSTCLATPLFDRGPTIANYVCPGSVSGDPLWQLCTQLDQDHGH